MEGRTRVTDSTRDNRVYLRGETGHRDTYPHARRRPGVGYRQDWGVPSHTHYPTIRDPVPTPLDSSRRRSSVFRVVHESRPDPATETRDPEDLSDDPNTGRGGPDKRYGSTCRGSGTR